MPLEVLLATPLNSNTIRVVFDVEPRHSSPLSSDDALNRLNWSISVFSGQATVPIVTKVENPRREPDLFSSTYPGAWSVDLRLDRRLLVSASYLVQASSIVSVDGAVLLPDNGARKVAPGAFVPRPRRRLISRSLGRDRTDVAYDSFTGRWRTTAAGGLATHEGDDSTKVRLLRRLISSPGGFSHLPGYGVGVESKRTFSSTRISDLRARVISQSKRESDVVDVRVDLSNTGSTLYVDLKAKTSTGVSAVSLGVGGDGLVLL